MYCIGKGMKATPDSNVVVTATVCGHKLLVFSLWLQSCLNLQGNSIWCLVTLPPIHQLSLIRLNIWVLSRHFTTDKTGVNLIFQTVQSKFCFYILVFYFIILYYLSINKYFTNVSLPESNRYVWIAQNKPNVW